jgi:hypothetical protein
MTRARQPSDEERRKAIADWLERESIRQIIANIRARAASGMPLRENTEECLRPKAGSPTGEAGDAQNQSAHKRLGDG